MKLNISEELKQRVEFAAKNGSKVAQILVKEFKKGYNDISKIVPENCKANYFQSRRSVYRVCDTYKRITVKITCCNKDVENEHFPDKGNPNAPFFKENRTELNPASFAQTFTAVQNAISRNEITSNDMTFFDSAIRVSSKVTIKLSSKMSDIEYAYNESNYYPWTDSTESNLHGSCMRHENVSRNAADFYANFCGSRIMYAVNSNNEILGRCIVWSGVKNLYLENTLTVVDRMYFSFRFIREMFIDFAKKSEFDLMKARDTYNSQTEMRVLKPLEYRDESYNTDETVDMYLWKPVPVVKWHKKGAPYCDTFYKIAMDSSGNLMLCNSPRYSNMADGIVYGIAEFRNTDGAATPEYKICPVCGKAHSVYDDYQVCNECMDAYTKRSVFGIVFESKLREHKGIYYPSVCFDGNKPNKWILLREKLERLYHD